MRLPESIAIDPYSVSDGSALDHIADSPISPADLEQHASLAGISLWAGAPARVLILEWSRRPSLVDCHRTK